MHRNIFTKSISLFASEAGLYRFVIVSRPLFIYFICFCPENCGAAKSTNYVVSTIQITNSIVDQRNPSISGDLVVWEDYRSGQAEIYGFNLATGEEFPVATSGREKFYPQIEGDWVIWYEKSSSFSRHLFAKNLISEETQTVVFGATYVDEYYSLVGDNLFYTAEINQGPGDESIEVYSYDLITGNRTQISQTPFDDDRFVNASGKYVAWQNRSQDVVYRDLSIGITTFIQTPEDWRDPVVSDDLIIGTYGSSGPVVAFDTNEQSFTELSVSGGNVHPSADGSFIVWINFTSLPGRLIGYDLNRNELFPIVSDSIVFQTQKTMEIDGNRLVWTKTDSNFSQFDIYVTELIPEPTTSALALAALCLATIRRQRILSECPHSSPTPG